jgi:hypothetical protein
MELVTGSRLVTRSVTVSPSRQYRTGPGTWPLTAVATCGAPVKLTGAGTISRSNSVPRKIGCAA